MSADVLDDLRGLQAQASERSHHYTAKTVERAIEEIENLREELMIYIRMYEKQIERLYG